MVAVIGADPTAGFTQFIYSASYPFLKPFQSVIPSDYAQGAFFEWSTLLAFVVYWLVASLIIYLIDLMIEPRVVRIED